LLLLAVVRGYGQDSYRDSMNNWLANYVENHEVVTGDDKQYFSFYPVDANYRVAANFKKANNSFEISIPLQSFEDNIFTISKQQHFHPECFLSLVK